MLLIKEQSYLDTLKPYIDSVGYNILPTAGGGDTISKNPKREEIINKISESNKNYFKNISLEQKNKWTSNISMSLKGRVFTDEHRQHKSEAQFNIKNHQYGLKWSEDIKRRQSEDHKGKNYCQIMKKVSINGIIYESILSACRALNIKRHIMRHRLDSEKFIDYFYV